MELGTLLNAPGILMVSPQDNRGIQVQPSTGITVNKKPGFFFHYDAERSVTMESDIGDDFAEDNTALQNQIALKPEMIAVGGYIAELSDFIQPGSPQDIIRQAVDKLVLLAPFTPEVSLTALLAYNAAAQAYATAANALAAAQSTLSAFGVGSPVQNEQQQAYMFFRTAWKSRKLFTVQTPWEIFQNVALKLVKPLEEEGTEGWTNFTIQFKQMTFTSQAGGAVGSAMQGRLAAAASTEVNFGSSSGTPGPSLSSVIA